MRRFEESCTQIEKAASEASIICLGDMNINTNKWNEDDFYLKKLAEKYQACLGSNGLEMVHFGDTWHRTHKNGTNKASAVDHCFSNQPEIILQHYKKNMSFLPTDHDAIIIDIDKGAPKKVAKQTIKSRDLRKLRANPQRYKKELSKIEWSKLDQLDGADSKVEF